MFLWMMKKKNLNQILMKMMKKTQPMKLELIDYIIYYIKLFMKRIYQIQK